MWYAIFWFTIGSILIYILFLKEGPNKVKFYLKYLTFFFNAVISATLLLPYNMLNARNAENIKIFTRTMECSTLCLGLKYEIRDEKFLQLEGGAIFIGNHQSVMDTLVMCRLFNKVRNAITVLIKKEVFYAWPFGISAYFAGVIFINRNNSASAHKELEETKKLILNKKLKIWFFPEGTRNKEYLKMLPFKKGAFNLAVEAQVPIIPVVFSPYYFLNTEKYIFNKGHVIVRCLEPISTAGLTRDDVPDLIKLCYGKMTEACKQLSEEISSSVPQ